MRKTRNYRARPRHRGSHKKRTVKRRRVKRGGYWFYPDDNDTESGFMNIFKKGKEAITGKVNAASTSVAASPVSAPTDMPKPTEPEDIRQEVETAAKTEVKEEPEPEAPPEGGGEEDDENEEGQAGGKRRRRRKTSRKKKSRRSGKKGGRNRKTKRRSFRKRK